MDRGTDPYTPNAGAPPRFLAGRRGEVEDFRTLLRRLGRGYTEQSVIVTGLRGVGKTVLLGQYRQVEPARAEGVEIDPAAVELIVDHTEGYPYFIQEFGRAVWDSATGSRITLADAVQAREVVEAVLDGSFFRAPVQRCSPEELRYMRAMAELGPQAQRAAEVPEVLGRTSEQVAPLRARLINKGLLFTPRYGYAKFTVPQFDRFIRRHMTLDAVPRSDAGSASSAGFGAPGSRGCSPGGVARPGPRGCLGVA